MNYYFTIIAILFSPLILIGQNTTVPSSSNILIRLQDKIDGYDFVDNYLAHSKVPVNFSIQRQVSKLLNIYSIEFNGRSAEGASLINNLQKDRNVLEIGYDTPLTYRNTTPNDDLYEEQWNLDRIEIQRVWNETRGGFTANGDPIVIAVLEKGIELEFP